MALLVSPIRKAGLKKTFGVPPPPPPPPPPPGPASRSVSFLIAKSVRPTHLHHKGFKTGVILRLLLVRRYGIVFHNSTLYRLHNQTPSNDWYQGFNSIRVTFFSRRFLTVFEHACYLEQRRNTITAITRHSARATSSLFLLSLVSFHLDLPGW